MILVSIAAVLVIGAAILFVPKDFAIERSVLVKRPQNTVFHFLKQVHKQDTWNPWMRSDAHIKTESRGQDGTVGFVYAWSGRMSGVGEQEITAIQEGSRLDFELRFQKPFQATNGAFLAAAAADPDAISTRVAWGLKEILES